MDEIASPTRATRGRWIFRLAGVAVLALILAMAARTSSGSTGKPVAVNGLSAATASAASCAAEDQQERAQQLAARQAAHDEDVQESLNPPANARAEDLAEHAAYVQAHNADSQEDRAEHSGYGACADSGADIALPAP